MIATGSQIRAARAGLGWSQEELANHAGIHAKAVAYWERINDKKYRPHFPPHPAERKAAVGTAFQKKTAPSRRGRQDTTMRLKAQGGDE